MAELTFQCAGRDGAGRDRRFRVRRVAGGTDVIFDVMADRAVLFNTLTEDDAQLLLAALTDTLSAPSPDKKGAAEHG